MALRLGKLCGNGAELWLRVQLAHDLWRLERTLRADLARIPTHRAGSRQAAGLRLSEESRRCFRRDPVPTPPTSRSVDRLASSYDAIWRAFNGVHGEVFKSGRRKLFPDKCGAFLSVGEVVITKDGAGL